jgi:hypothetical protein
LPIRQIVSGQPFTKNLLKRFINRHSLNSGNAPGIGFLYSESKKIKIVSLSDNLPVGPDNVAMSSNYWGNIHDMSAPQSSGSVFLAGITTLSLIAERYFFISALKE